MLQRYSCAVIKTPDLVENGADAGWVIALTSARANQTFRKRVVVLIGEINWREDWIRYCASTCLGFVYLNIVGFEVSG